MELLGDLHSGHDVVRAVGVDAAAHLSADDRNQRLKLEVWFRRLGRVGLGGLEFVGVVFGLIERLAHQGGQAHAGHRVFFVGAVAALWIFAHRKLHLLGAGQDHLLGGVYVAQLDDDAGAADHVGRAGQHADGGEARFAHPVDGVIVRVDGIGGAHLRGDRAAHLVAVQRDGGVGARLVKVGNVGVAVDQARHDPAAGGVDHLRVVWNFDLFSHRFDFAVLN